MSRAVSLAVCALLAIVHAHDAHECEVFVRTTAGCACGARLWTSSGFQYASFRGVPYAKQPLGELRFQELQPPEPWHGILNATENGPICPQDDVLYGPLMQPTAMSESCIHANIHVPLDALPTFQSFQGRSVRQVVKPPLFLGERIPRENASSPGLPILVFVHGGGFAFGSGDDDFHGPEHLVRSGVIVITFNYRLNVFGYLSLSTPKIPGNNGLRDIITLLNWVRENARSFGGDPGNVTLAGQSAGAASVHLLTVSPLAQGLFNKAIIMSGTALPSFYSTSPAYAKYAADNFLKALNITSTDPDEIHQQLVDMPLDTIMAVNKQLQYASGLTYFFPVIESPLPGVKAVIPEDTQTLLEKGYGKDIPLLIGFTNMEGETFRKRFTEIDIVGRIEKLPLLVLPPHVLFSVPPDVALELAKEVSRKYFNGAASLDKFVELSSAAYFLYPALKVAEYRKKTGGAPSYMYEFAYDAPNNPIRRAHSLNYSGGAGHVEDMVNIFQVNSVQVPWNPKDEQMKRLMNEYVVNFITNTNSAPTRSGSWKPISKRGVMYLSIRSPTDTRLTRLTKQQEDMVGFFDDITGRS